MTPAKHARRDHVHDWGENYCTYCGARLDEAAETAVGTRNTESFCDTECEDAWNIDDVASVRR